MFRQAVATTLLVLFSVSAILGQEVEDYLGAPGPIAIGDTNYVLAWSSNPQPGYFKQEYLPEGTAPENYESMVIVEFLAGDTPIAEVVSAQVDMVNARKSADPVANSAVLRNDETGEFVLDFLLSAKDESGEFILEWNGYRYAEATLAGKPGALLFGISERSYGNADAESFLTDLRAFKAQRIQELTKAAMPALE